MTAQPFGLWPGSVSPAELAQAVRLADLQWDSDGTTLVWLEGRSGQGVLVAADRSGDAPRDLTAAHSVRAKVGYGGGDFAVASGAVFFADQASGRLMRRELASTKTAALTPAFGSAAAPTPSPDGQWLVFVHSSEGEDCLAAVSSQGGWPQKIASGHDFYMQPCWHPSSEWLAFVAWDHPNMPWDGTTLYLAHASATPHGLVLGTPLAVAGGLDEAIFQPAFSPDGRYLAYVCDATGWGHLYVRDLETGTVRQLTSGEYEHAEPAWVQGTRTFGWAADSKSLIAVRNTAGVASLIRVPLEGDVMPIAGLEGYTWLDQPAIAPHGEAIALIASSSSQPAQLVLLEAGKVRVLRHSLADTLPKERLVAAAPAHWEAGGQTVHGLLYLPPSYQPAAEGPRPPAIVMIHGGPTAQAVASFDGDAQFFAGRGYTVLDVNYRGSTGYGRAYMLALRGQWGVCDVEDAISGAKFLAEAGYADPARIVIMGGSAGGFTVLEALCRAPGLFRAGLCLFGVANMFTLAADTHKFEARYLDSLLGPLPEAAAIYRERSPIFHAELLRDPIAVFQGSEDQVVPPAQSEAIVASLRARQIAHEYHLYPGEGHGWRKRETIEAFWQSVERFLRQYVIFS